MLTYSDRYLTAYLFRQDEEPDKAVLAPGVVLSTPTGEMLVLKKHRQNFTDTTVRGVVAWYAEIREKEVGSTINRDSFQLVGLYTIDSSREVRLRKVTELCRGCMHYALLLTGQCGKLEQALHEKPYLYYRCSMKGEVQKAWKASFLAYEYRDRSLYELMEWKKRISESGEEPESLEDLKDIVPGEV